MTDLERGPLEQLAAALPGQVLPGSDGRRYPLGVRIGEGGQGWVFRATWNGSVDVVVKVLRPDAVTPETLARFQREANVLRTLSQQATPNPHVVRFFDHAYATIEVGVESWDLPFTVLELVEGITLERAIADAQPSGIGLERSRRILRHVVLALRDVHAHDVIHRDLKPSNILLASPGGRELAKVTDFGLAKLLAPGMQRTTALAGATVGYAPPEQFEKGNLRVGRHTDVFSLAAIFYETVCGLPAFPFHAQAHPLFVVVRILTEARPSFGRVSKHLPPELAERLDVVAALDVELSRALSPNPSERHATVMEFHDAIERALTALSATPSMPESGMGGIKVRASGPPPGSVQETARLGGARTMRADEMGPVVPFGAERALLSEAKPSAFATPAEASIGWRVRTPGIGPSVLLGITVAPLGDAAVGAGPHGTARWDGRVWGRLDVPGGLDARAFRATAWLGGTVFLAGALPTVLAIASDQSFGMWRFNAPGVTFHSARADASGLLLTGERATPGGIVGVLAEVPLGARGGLPLRLMEVAGCGPLRAAARLSSGVLACGDMGALVFAREGSVPRTSRICDVPLHAVLPFGPDTAVVVGNGGFAFRVSETLEARLEGVQTQRDLLALARGPNGVGWCGGAEQRVLMRGPSGWLRAGSLPGPGRVIALHVTTARVLTFCDDGGVLEGSAG
jgi:serine/threonine-protein kinase